MKGEDFIDNKVTLIRWRKCNETLVSKLREIPNFLLTNRSPSPFKFSSRYCKSMQSMQTTSNQPYYFSYPHHWISPFVTEVPII